MKSLIKDKKLLKNGGRKAVVISQKELEDKIVSLGVKHGAKEQYNGLLYEAVCEIFYKDSRVKKDLSKITFGAENLDTDDSNGYEHVGFHTLDNGFSFLLCMAGDDSEVSVGFILYWDGKSIRGYVPVLGNTFNPEFKCAFGSEEDDLDRFEHFVEFAKKTKGFITPEEEDEFDCGEYYIDFELFKEDIEHRIEIPGAISQPKPSQACANTVVKNTPAKNTPSVNLSDFFDVENCTPLDLVLIPQIVARYDLTPEEKVEFIKSNAYKELKKTFEEKVDEFEKRVFDEVFSEHENDIFATIDEIADGLAEKHQNGTSVNPFGSESENDDSKKSASNINKQYYWQFNGDTDGYDGDDEYKLHVLVAEKSYYDQFGELDDRGVDVPELEALGFLEGSESCYETDYTFKGTPTKASIRKLINTLDNFTEHKMF